MMKISPSIVVLAAISAHAGSASADTMYKCTDPNGKVSFSDQPCTGKSKTSTLNVIAPQSKKAIASEASQQWEEPESELDRLRRADGEFQKRLAERERDEARERLRAARERTSRLQAEERERRRQEEQDARDAAEAMRAGAAARRERGW